MSFSGFSGKEKMGRPLCWAQDRGTTLWVFVVLVKQAQLHFIIAHDGGQGRLSPKTPL